MPPQVRQGLLVPKHRWTDYNSLRETGDNKARRCPLTDSKTQNGGGGTGQVSQGRQGPPFPDT